MRGKVARAVKRLIAFALVWVALVVVAPGAHADEGAALADAAQSSDPQVAADALYRMAEAEDAAGDFAHAVQHYRAAVTRLPSFRYAPKAMTRASQLEAHSEGDYRPFARLDAVRRDPKTSDDAAAIDSLARDAEGFPPGPTRGEARMVCADAYLARLHRRADGEAELRRVTDDPKADPLLRRQAAVELLDALLDDGNLEGAREVTESEGKLLDRKQARRIVVASRRRWLHRGSLVVLALFGLLAATAVVRASLRGALGGVWSALRGGAWYALAYAAWLAIAGGGFASAYETGNAEPFYGFAATLLPIAALARAWSAAGSRSAPARVVRATMCATVVLAAAFLVLEAINVQYLEGFSL